MKRESVPFVSATKTPSLRISWSDRRLIAFCLYVAVLSLACWGPLVALGRYALNEELHSHILLMPLVSAYLVILKRSSLGLACSGSAAGALFGAFLFASISVGLYLWEFSAGSNALAQHDRMVLTAACFGLLLVAGGFLILRASLMRRLAFPFALLVFMVPLPTVVVEGAEDFLMKASAEVAHWFFQWTGTPVFRSGQVMELPGMVLEVARSCSGVRSTLVLLITSLIASYLFLSSNIHRGILTLMVIPLGILRNAVRILVIGLLCVHVRPEMIDSWIHHQGGPLFFAASLVPLFAMAAWFRHRERKYRSCDEADDKSSPLKNPGPHPVMSPEENPLP